MRKDSRLSFRISPELSDEIDMAIRKSGGEIRDRSEFGTKAVQFFLDSLRKKETKFDILMKATLSLADQLNIQTEDLERVRSMANTSQSEESIETHPYYESLIELSKKLPDSVQVELSSRLAKVKYDEINSLYNEFRDRYFLEGTGPKTGSKKIKSQNK